MEDKQKQERSFELRSEKVRSIVGQVPSSLIRYGITAIGAVLVILVLTAYYLPYKRVYTGVAIVKDIGSEKIKHSDSIEIDIYLRFEGKTLDKARRQQIYLTNGQIKAEGILLTISPIRDTLERQRGQARFLREEILHIENQATDFCVIQRYRSVLSLILRSH